MSENDFLSFDRALEKLSLEEEDLKRLISAGEIRAFRDGSKMRLRAEDVDRVAQDLGVAESVGEEEAGEVLEVEEVLFTESAEDEGMVTTQLSEEDTLLDDDLEEVEVAEEPAPAARPSRSARSGARSRIEEPEAQETGFQVLCYVATFFLLLYGGVFVLGMLSARSNGMTAGVVNMVHGE